MKLRCIIIDDEPLARQGLEDYMADVDFLELMGSFRSAMEANSFMQEYSPDLLLLDIKMPKISGLEWLRSLKNPPMVIFTTAYREHAVEGFELEAIDYLVKPISFQRFLKAVNKAKGSKKEVQNTDYQQEEDWFFIKEEQQYTKIRKADILFVESLKDYVFIHTAEKRHMALLSLKQVEESLQGGHFMRVHRSYLVALDKVAAMEGNILQIGQHHIPMSKTTREEVYKRLLAGKLWKRDG